jgi:hypothetical protein
MLRTDLQAVLMLAQASRGVLVMVCGVLLAAAAAAQQPTPEQAGAIRQACRGDYGAHCSGVPTGGAAALDCLKRQAAQLSAACRAALQPVMAAPAAGAATSSTGAARSATAVTIPPTVTWPHTVTAEGGTAIIYQPQVMGWPERRTLDTRIAMAVTPEGATVPLYGTAEVAFASIVDFATRSVTLTEPRLVSTQFPAADAAQAQRFETKIRAALAAMGPREVPLDMVLLSLRERESGAQSVALNDAPPRIFYSARPASLVVFDGTPVLAPVSGTTLSVAVNTNWRVFYESDGKSWYLLNSGAWLTAPDANGPWVPAGRLPAAFSTLPADANFADVRPQVPGRKLAPKDTPTVFVSTTPAEIIITDGPARFTPIAGTSLDYVSNTAVAVFRDRNTKSIYYLVSGRWFSAPGFDGPWSFATNALPPDFRRIPPDSPRGSVLASVPGTVQAQEALIHAQIPQQATLKRDAATVSVVYAGPPKFEAIPGTTMYYAVNTSYDVVRVGESYYACYQGAWFVAPAPTGAWTLAPLVPEVIYTIPPASPLYRCTYVRVYGVTPTTVTYGYTAGYTMAYVSSGVVVYGTGFYYPPYLYPAAVPIYYPYPVSYAGATYYNPATGAWARGGAVYGPYYGARGGTAYNPTTGAWAQGGAVYGPYGGAGAFSAYNPTTGSYAHGSAVYGSGGATANADWYNARTGVTGSTNQNSNAYGRWGSSTLSGPNQTVHTQSQSDARGSAGSFSSTSGAEGAGVRGAGGNSAGAVKTSSGNVYAGADGNVYKKTDSGWEKYGGSGSWSQVQAPAAGSASKGGAGADARTVPQERPGAAGSTSMGAESGMRSRFAGEGGGGFQQLEQDHAARFGGAERQRQYGAMEGGRFGGGGFGRRR